MRNADQTRARILDAARQILARDGFAGLGVNALANEAGVGKPLVYRYFGNMEGVVTALVSGLGSGLVDGPVMGSPAEQPAAVLSAGPGEAIEALIRYGRGLAGDRTGRDLLAWSLAAGDGPALGDWQERPAASASPLAGSGQGTDREAIMVLMQAAIAFLLLCRDRHSAWAGMPLAQPRHMARLERAVATIIDATFTGKEVTEK